MRNKKLIIQQLDQKLSLFAPLISLSKPSIGWIKSIRMALNMTLEQMGHRLSYIVNKTHLNMVMEDQGNNEEYLKASVEELSDELKRNVNHIIWD